MKEREGETRREFLTRCGKVGLAGLSTILLLELGGTKKIVRKLSRKDPNAFLAGIDFEAYNHTSKISMPGKDDIKITHWREKFSLAIGPYLSCAHKKGSYPSILLRWGRDMSANALSFRPHYGELTKRFIEYVKRDKDYEKHVSEFIERNGKADINDLSGISKDRKFILRFKNNPEDYSFLKGKVKNPVNYLLEKVAYQCVEFDNIMIELEAPDKSETEHNKKIDLLEIINKESFGKKHEIIVNLNGSHSYNHKKKLWEPEKSKIYWEHDSVNAVTITDVSSSIEQLNHSIEIFKKAVHPKKLFVRLVMGPERVKAGFNDSVLDLEKRILAVEKSAANAVFVNDGDGSWLFSGKGNPLDYGKRERMITKNYKEFLGIT